MDTLLIDAFKAGSNKENPHCSTILNSNQKEKRTERDEDAEVLVLEEPPQKKVTPSKRSKGKKVVKMEEEEDRGARWKDDEIEMLISLHGEMDDEFKMNGKKQGVDMWHKLHACFLSQIPGLKKSHVATKKKFNSLFKIYKEDKLANNVSGESHHESKFYDQFESWFSHSGSIHKHMTASANGPDLHVEDSVPETECDDIQDNTQKTTSTNKASKKTNFNDESMVLFGKMVESSEGLLKSFNRTTKVLNNQLDRC